MENNYKTIVGMEIHVELKTKSKMFCGCKNDPFHAPKPNIYTCPVCLGLPGALPVPNKKAVEWTIMLGLALGATIQEFSKFDRKNYFYPDLPKGYQISQYDQPIARHGELKFKIYNSESKIEEEKTVRIHRVHLEEDTGKLLHAMVNGKPKTLIDFNRSGVSLVEIVTEPDINSSDEAKAFLKKLHQIIRYLGISDANMEKGSMRLEPNISVKKNNPALPPLNLRVGEERLDRGMGELPAYKVEVKNINSFNFVKKAIDYEVERQIEILERGETPVQETRGWEEKKGITLPQRRKEEAHDYRYFPEPDIPPMRFIFQFIDKLEKQIPELPDAKFARFIKDYQLKPENAQRLTEEKELADFFEKCIKYFREAGSRSAGQLTTQSLANWIINKKVDISKVTPEELVKTIVQATQVAHVDESELEAVVKKVMAANTKAVADYKSGKTGVIMFLLGMCMKELQGRADATTIRKLLENELQ